MNKMRKIEEKRFSMITDENFKLQNFLSKLTK